MMLHRGIKPMGREVLVCRAANSKAEYISCTECTWGVAVVATTSLDTTDTEILRIFNGHKCEDSPRCHAPGCTNSAFAGFQPFLDAGSFDNPTAKILGNKNWWCASHSSLADKFSNVDGNWLTPSH